MIGRLLAAVFILLATPAIAADPGGSWAFRVENTTLFQFEIHHAASGWSGVWVRPETIDTEAGQRFTVAGRVIRRTARQVRLADGLIQLTFDDPRPGAIPDPFRIHMVDAMHAEADYLDSGMEPLALIRVPSAAPIGQWDPHHTYVRVIERPTDAEMTAIFDADQTARRGGAAIDWSVVGKQDEQRRVRTQALLDSGALRSGDDFFHAAFIFQHGGKPDDYLKAHLLAIVAVARGKPSAAWIAAAALDRYLQNIGQPQVLGTQFLTSSDRRTTQEPFNRTLLPDALRSALGVPSLSEQEQRRNDMEKRAMKTAAAQTVKIVPPPLKPVAPSPTPRRFADMLEPVACAPLPGAQALLERPAVRWIVVGEVHGTEETPAAFADLVCLASAARPVSVAVEQPTSEQPAIDAFIASDGGRAATGRFLQSAMWTQPMKDGRSSMAYFRLFQRLRALRAAGRIVSVVAFAPLYRPGPAGFDQADYENSMAATLLDKTRDTPRTLVLVGNIHAMRTPPSWAKPAYLPMAGLLPADATVTLDTRGNGGTFWACAPECRTQTMSGVRTIANRGLTLEGVPDGPYSGVLDLGVPTTASPPRPAAAVAP